MRMRGIDPGDLVLVNKRGRLFHARVRSVDPSGALRVDPIERNISYREAAAREIADHWRHAGRPRDEAAQPPEQLDLNEWITA
jgi:hypothetical protein